MTRLDTESMDKKEWDKVSGLNFFTPSGDNSYTGRRYMDVIFKNLESNGSDVKGDGRTQTFQPKNTQPKAELPFVVSSSNSSNIGNIIKKRFADDVDRTEKLDETPRSHSSSSQQCYSAQRNKNPNLQNTNGNLFTIKHFNQVVDEQRSADKFDDSYFRAQFDESVKKPFKQNPVVNECTTTAQSPQLSRYYLEDGYKNRTAQQYAVQVESHQPQKNIFTKLNKFNPFKQAFISLDYLHPKHSMADHDTSFSGDSTKSSIDLAE